MMHRLKKIVKQMWEETMGAEQYAMCALNTKDEDRTLAEMYHSMANQEMTHAENLMSQASRVASLMHDEPHIESIWNWERDKIMEQMAHSKYYIDAYRK